MKLFLVLVSVGLSGKTYLKRARVITDVMNHLMDRSYAELTRFESIKSHGSPLEKTALSESAALAGIGYETSIMPTEFQLVEVIYNLRSAKVSKDILKLTPSIAEAVSSMLRVFQRAAVALPGHASEQLRTLALSFRILAADWVMLGVEFVALEADIEDSLRLKSQRHGKFVVRSLLSLTLFKDLLARTETRLNSLRYIGDREARNFLTAEGITDDLPGLLNNVATLVSIATTLNGKTFAHPSEYREQFFVLSPMGRGLIVKITKLSDSLPAAPVDGPATLVKERRMLELVIDEWIRVIEEINAISKENGLKIVKSDLDYSDGKHRIWDRV